MSTFPSSQKSIIFYLVLCLVSFPGISFAGEAREALDQANPGSATDVAGELAVGWGAAAAVPAAEGIQAKVAANRALDAKSAAYEKRIYLEESLELQRKIFKYGRVDENALHKVVLDMSQQITKLNHERDKLKPYTLIPEVEHKYQAITKEVRKLDDELDFLIRASLLPPDLYKKHLLSLENKIAQKGGEALAAQVKHDRMLIKSKEKFWKAGGPTSAIIGGLGALWAAEKAYQWWQYSSEGATPMDNSIQNPSVVTQRVAPKREPAVAVEAGVAAAGGQPGPDTAGAPMGKSAD